MRSSKVLLADSVINLILGFLLLIFSRPLIYILGVPGSEAYFYPNILGGVLLGVGIALLIECYRSSAGLVGLGLGGAIAINLCGGFVLATWLIFGDLNIPLRGQIFLWVLVFILVAISAVELFVHLIGGSKTKANKT